MLFSYFCVFFECKVAVTRTWKQVSAVGLEESGKATAELDVFSVIAEALTSIPHVSYVAQILANIVG